MKQLIATTLLFAATTAAVAEPALMLGVSHNFGGATGITLKVLSTNREEKAALALGVSYAPGREASRWSWDTGLAYNFKSTSLVLSYDWVPGETQLSFGLANLKAPAKGGGAAETCVDTTVAAKVRAQAAAPCPV